MLSFQAYNEMDALLENEVATTRRRNMEHIQKMKPEEFIQLMRNASKAGGVLHNVKVSLKVDGLGARFGKDAKGNKFFEGSRTGPIYDVGAFSAFARSKTDNVEIIGRAQHYDNMLAIIKKAKFVDVLPNNTKVVGEIFYNPMAKAEDNSLVFVTVKYDKKKLGDEMTIVPFQILDATTGRTHPNSKEILKTLYAASDNKFRIVDPKLTANAIPVQAIAQAASAFSNDSLALMKSRKKADKEAKQNLLNVLQKLKDDFADFLLKTTAVKGKEILGDEIEGLVFELPVGAEGETAPFKSTTQKFKSEFAAKKAAMKKQG